MIKVLDRLIDLIQQNKKYKIEIIGYTDDSGEDSHNLNLSKNRANSVKKHLLTKNIGSEINSIGKGESNPKYDNNNKSIKSKNRRVEIFFK
jgi:outer membrane protein OmpA-like peptidoglycan-associated protein